MLCFFFLAMTSAYGDQSFIDGLNTAYQGYDPNDDNSPAGVMVTGFSAVGDAPWLADCQDCGDLYGVPIPTSNCKISGSIINAKNSHMQRDWKAKHFADFPQIFPEGCKFYGTCDMEVGLYPVGQFSILKGEFVPVFDTGGAIFGAAVDEAMKCAYPFDGATMTRPNRGCGCTSLVGTVCPPNKAWPCPTTLNTCTDKDPLSHFMKPHPINENSSVLSACQCTEMGMTASDDPLWSGIAGLEYAPGLPKCMWSGPQFFGGKGRNELRQALRQQYNFRKHALFPWNEIILDGQSYNNLFAKKASETIVAFWYPRASHCGKKCKAGVYATRDHYVAKYGVEVPVIMLDITNGTAPFMAADQRQAQEAFDEPADGGVEITMV